MKNFALIVALLLIFMAGYQASWLMNVGYSGLRILWLVGDILYGSGVVYLYINYDESFKRISK